jgi:hypothetical protein
MDMYGGGTLKGIFQTNPNNTQLLKEFIDMNRNIHPIYQDSPYSPQLLVYLDNATQSRSSVNDPLTLEEAKTILEKLGLPTEDDPNISINFYGKQQIPQNSVSTMADTALRLNLGQGEQVSQSPILEEPTFNGEIPQSPILEQQEQLFAEPLQLIQPAPAPAPAPALEQPNPDIDFRRAELLRNTLLSKRNCEEELAGIREQLDRARAERESVVLEIQQKSERIQRGLLEIEQRDRDLSALRNNFETLTGQLRQQSLVGQTNARLMSEISELRQRIEVVGQRSAQLMLDNEQLSRQNADKQAVITEKNEQIQRLIDSARRVEGQEEQIAQLSEEREQEQQRNRQLEQQKQSQLQSYSGQIERLREQIIQFEVGEEPTSHIELLRRISVINKLLHFYTISKTILGDSPQGELIQQQISQNEVRLTRLHDTLAAKGRECDQLLVRIQELEGTIRGLLQQIIGGIQGLPERLGQLRTLNEQGQTIIQRLQEIQRTSQNSQEIQSQRQQLSGELDRISREIALLQGQIQGRFQGIESAITAGNAEVTQAMRTQSAAGIEAILAGQRAGQLDIGNRISEQSQQLAQQTTQLTQLRGEFTTLQQQSQAQSVLSQRTHQLLEDCFRGKHAAEQEVRASQSMAEQLRTQLATLEAQKTAAVESQRLAAAEARRLQETVQATAQAGLQAGQIAERAQQAQARAEDRLRQEQQQGNPREIQRLQQALAQEEQRARQAEQARQQALEQQQRVAQQQQQAEEEAQRLALETATAQGALEQAKAARDLAQTSLRNAVDQVAQRDMDAEAQRAQQLERLQQQFEQQCNQRIQAAQQEAQRISQAEILQITARAVAAEQAQAAIQAAVDARILAETRTAVAGERAASAAASAAALAGERAAALLREQAAVAGERAAAAAAQAAAIQAALGPLQVDIAQKDAIINWHRRPIIDITNPNAIPVGGLVAGTQITFNVQNRGPGGRTVAFFYYGNRTEYMDIIDDTPKNYTIQAGLQNIGAFNF